MTEKIHVTPLKGLQVPNPEEGGKFLKPEGAKVNKSTYWTRQQRDGSVKIRPKNKTAPAKKAVVKEAK